MPRLAREVPKQFSTFKFVPATAIEGRELQQYVFGAEDLRV